ncbi:tripartite tricarboxylate transporter substrate binding protein [Yoonia sp. BS5-3]|uniref:Bug family tripartite tricarboxylate transporter substrate binding protein n=1 Tax=Yoonia phaeophyticola TaxID=3137369 RepID=A0ABZ2V7G0_9RHOB
MNKHLIGAVLAITGAIALFAAGPAKAEWPEKPITIIYPWPAADPTSAVMRTIGELVSEELGQPVVINNVTGAGGTKALATAISADPDGYTLVSNWVAAQVSAKLFNPDLPYTNDDFVPVAGVFAIPFTLTVAANHPADDISAFVDWAKAEGRTINYGVCAPQSVPRLIGEQFMTVAEVPYNPIPFSGGCGGDNVTGLMNGTLDASVAVVPLINAFEGQIKHLGLITDERHPIDPSLPSAAEQGYPVGWGDTAFGWGGVAALSGTPDDVVEKLQDAFRAVLAGDALAAQLEGNVAAMIKYVGPDASAQLWLDSETLLAQHVANVLRSTN